MNKQAKRWLTGLIATAMMLSMVACGDEPTAEDSIDRTTISQEQQDQTPTVDGNESVDDNSQPESIDPDIMIGGDDDSKTDIEPVNDAIADGNLNKAYAILSRMDTDEAVEMREKLVAVPISESVPLFGGLHTYTYDENGYCLTKTYTNSDGVLENTTSYTYDDNGNLLTETCTSFETFDGTVYTFDSEITYTYDDNGNLLTKKDPDSLIGGEYIYTYDNNGNLLTEKYTDSDGDWEETVYTYDEGGNCLTEKDADSDGNWSEAAYTYDEGGNLLTVKRTDSDDIRGETVYTYDEGGNCLTRKYTNSNGDWNEDIRTYDEGGQLPDGEIYQFQR